MRIFREENHVKALVEQIADLRSKMSSLEIRDKLYYLDDYGMSFSTSVADSKIDGKS